MRVIRDRGVEGEILLYLLRQLRGEHAWVAVGGDHADASYVFHAHHVPETVAAQYKPVD